MDNPYPQYTGLSDKEVQDRKKNGLINKSPRSVGRTLSEILVENIFSLFNGIILAIIIFVLGFFFKTSDMRLLLDSFGILLVAILNTLIAIIQELRAKSALDKVNLLLTREVRVLRDGKIVTLAPEEILMDDLVLLVRGDQAVVDGRTEASTHLEMDESLLTGESVPIEKDQGDPILSGSFATAGMALMRAEKVGSNSFAASVTTMAKGYKFTLTPLQKRINFFIKALFVIALGLMGLQLGSELLRPSGLSEVDFVRKIATILISMVPQGLVLFSSVTFALGIFRISRIGALIQKLNAIENFSSIRVVCTDKTGTLTENRLKLERLTLLQKDQSPQDLELLLGTYAKLSVEKNATLRVLESLPFIPEAEAADEIPFSSRTKYGVVKIRTNGGEETYILGAWDVLSSDLPSGLENFRNLFFGKVVGTFNWEKLKESSQGINLQALGVISLSDTIRNDVYDALELFEGNGIQVKVLSGDAPESVRAVLKAIGWNINPEQMTTGAELDQMLPQDFSIAAQEKRVFARLKPEHKLGLMKALKAQGIRTAMIGDGVNDLPAIKEAHIGIAMEEGSSITKEVADIVLLKNKFSLLPGIFNEGNKIVNTVGAVAKLFLTKNFMVILMTLLSVFFLLDFPLTPRRVSFLNLFGIGLPAFILALGNKNAAPMKNFLKEVISYILISASVVVGASYLSLGLISPFHAPQAQGQMVMMFTLTFLFIVNFLIIAIQSKSSLGIYLGFGLFLLAGLVVFSTVDWDFFPYRFVKMFYEIETLRGDLWPSVMEACGLSGALLVILQSIRLKLMK